MSQMSNVQSQMSISLNLLSERISEFLWTSFILPSDTIPEYAIYERKAVCQSEETADDDDDDEAAAADDDDDDW